MRKRISIEVNVDGRQTNTSIDQLVAAFIPDGAKRHPYAVQCVNALWQHLHPGQPIPDDPIGDLSEKFDCGYSSVIATALVFGVR